MPHQYKKETNEAFLKRSAEYFRNRREKRMTAAREYLGNKCIRCNTTEDLHFDHVDPSTKKSCVSNAIYWSEERFWNEVKKCQLLCFDCHIEKSLEDGMIKYCETWR